MPRRDYFQPFATLARNLSVRRAAILMGPRRVGKTVMLLQFIADLLDSGQSPGNILYASIDAPIYTDMPLEKFVRMLTESPRFRPAHAAFVIFDEIQYLRNWERHLKDLVDAYPEVKFIASGSAAAALRLASTESGAGRFSDFSLPPLSFSEFLNFIGRDAELIGQRSGDADEETKFHCDDIAALNAEFVNYLNFGGFPEAVTNQAVRANQDQFVRNDIIDKVLLKDLPALYGIQNIQELNRLFSFIAYNTGQELSLNTVASKMEISKPTVSRYIEYLESAFLIMKLGRIDASAKSLKRETSFKPYLTNTSMRAAIFSPVEESNSDLIGHLAESAILSQWSHSPVRDALKYARWEKGEIDLVCLQGADYKPEWAVEIKWTDAIDRPDQKFAALAAYIRDGRLKSVTITTKSIDGALDLAGLRIPLTPSSLYCYSVGKKIALSQRP
ncbi:MAG: ATP-binding protein [Parvularculaceae bacterium]